MHNVFSTFASSRFINREAVVETLRTLAQRLKAQHAEVVVVYLFGSFARGTATPRSDADILVEMATADIVLKERLAEAAQTIFMAAPVPVEVFVLASEHLRERRGIAEVVVQEGVRLA